MVGHADGAPGGAESAVIEWNPIVLGSGVPTFDSTNMLIKDDQPLVTPLTYKLKWLAQDADADATAALQVGQTLPLPSACLLYTSPSPRDGLLSRMPSSA